MNQHYVTLESKPTDSIDAIKKKRSELIKRYHPDNKPDDQKDTLTKKLAAVNTAWDWIEKNHGKMSDYSNPFASRTKKNPFEDSFANQFADAFTDALNEEMLRRMYEELKRYNTSKEFRYETPNPYKYTYNSDQTTSQTENSKFSFYEDFASGTNVLAVRLSPDMWSYNQAKQAMACKFVLPRNLVIGKRIHRFKFVGKGPFGEEMGFMANCPFDVNTISMGDFLIRGNDKFTYPIWVNFTIR